MPILSVVAGGLFGLSAQAEMAVVLEEDFSSCTNITGVAASTSITINGIASTILIDTILPTYGLDGWSGSRVYCAFTTNSVGVTNRMVKLGSSSSDLGWIETPKMNLAGNQGDFTVTFCAGAWFTDNEGTTIYVDHYTDNGEERIAPISLSKLEMREYIIHGTNGTANSSIRFSAQNLRNNRFFLDDVRIESEQSTKRVTITQAETNVLAGQTASAVVTANDLGTPVPVAVEDTNIPSGNPPSFDGTNFSWIPQATGEFWVRFVASNATDRIFHIMTISVGLPVPAAPAVETSAGSIFLSWMPVPGATGYSVQAYQLATELELFAEDFVDCTNRTATTAAQNITVIGATSTTLLDATLLSTYGLDGWSGARVFCAFSTNTVASTNFMVKIGSSDANRGWLQTPPIDLSENDGECALTFRAGKWTNDRGEINVLHIYEAAGEVYTNILRNITGLSDIALTKYTVVVTGGTTNSTICFTAETAGSNNNRFFLDDVRISDMVETRIEIPSSQIVVNGTTARVFGLSPLSEYLCTVTATDGVSETVSPEVLARTTTSTVIILR